MKRSWCSTHTVGNSPSSRALGRSGRSPPWRSPLPWLCGQRASSASPARPPAGDPALMPSSRCRGGRKERLPHTYSARSTYTVNKLCRYMTDKCSYAVYTHLYIHTHIRICMFYTYMYIRTCRCVYVCCCTYVSTQEPFTAPFLQV